jgi:TetR/AcrR family transcriptional regulator, cholesterol catabolism regulator
VREHLDRRTRILTSAAALFASKGVAATTVREIADQVGILSGSLYHHFESKEAIVDEILSSYLADLRQRYAALSGQDGPRARLHGLVRASLETAAAHPHATEIYQNDLNYLRRFERFSYLPQVGRQVQQTWLDAITAGMTEGVFRADLDAGIFCRLLRDAVWLSVRWFTPTDEYPLDRFVDDCTSIFFDGAATNSG